VTPPDPPTFTVTAVPGIGEVSPDTDLPSVVVAAAAAAGIPLRAGDVVCVASKIVSKWLGLTAADRDAAVAADTRAVVARRTTPRGVTTVARSAAGPVMAAAGVDESNTGPSGAVLRLPGDPDAAAARLRAAIAALTGTSAPGAGPVPAIVLTDTAGRPWRDGQTDFALGIAGLAPVDDGRGRPDSDGRLMAVTVRALADEVAAAADLVKGKVGRVPVAVVRGLAAWVTDADGPGAASLVRDPADDWFSAGALEAVHEALAAGPLDEAPPGRLPGEPAAAWRRVLRIAATGRAPAEGAIGQDPDAPDTSVLVTGDPVAVGRLVERLLTAAAAERLPVTAGPTAAGWRVTRG
jgi:coenzyme F420-0:L-glutamate ligase/coenzyme F420-1:gamma-L-glutamate ligase